MEIEKVPKQIWLDTITGKINCQYDFLALKILLERLKLNAKLDSSPRAYDKYAGELKDFFIKSIKIPSAQKDLQKIMSKGGI
jgi:hypothetical protein